MTAAFITRIPPDSEPDLVFRAALQDLLQMGLRVAGAAARLAEVEGQAVEALATAATDAARVVTKPHSMESAVEAGRIADASAAARDTAATRIALITGSFERAARAVRRTVALARRIEDKRPLRDAGPTGTAPTQAPRTGPERLCDDLADRPDPADELGGRTTLDVTRDICRDLELAALPGEEYQAPWQAPETANAPAHRPAHSAEPFETANWHAAPPGSPEPDT